jgi:histidinol-phosphate aminotransferase
MQHPQEAGMSFSRREFVRKLGVGGAGIAAASHVIGYGREDLLALAGTEQARGGGQRAATAGGPAIRLSSNENLRGPGPKVLEVLRTHPSRDLGLGYPPPNVSNFVDAIAALHGAKSENVIISTGSGEILTAAVMAYCAGAKTLVTGDPSYGSPAQTAQRIKAPVKFIAVDPKSLALDLEGMIRAAIGTGLVFLCNPNNPTSSVQTTADLEQTVRTIKQRSPETGILIDEAYLEYATLPGSGTMVKLALELPGVFISRTFSKAYGMAGMRMGYAVGQPETVRKLSNAWGLGSINELQAVAGIAAVKDQAHIEWERQENKRVREWTQGQFKAMGFDSPESQTNFIFVNIGRPAVEFRDGCRALGVSVGRDFPPMEKTYARISLGRMEDMEKAMPVFKQVLGKT